MATLVALLGRILLIYIVLNTLSCSSSSGATSGKRSNRSQTHFFSGNASRYTGFLLIQLYYYDVFLFTNVICCFILSIKMLPIRNRAVRHRFNANQQRVLLVYLLLSAKWLERELWVHPFCQEATTKGEFFLMYPNLRKYPAKFFCSYRMSICQFDNLLHLLRPVISKQINNYCESISAEERLVITLR